MLLSKRSVKNYQFYFEENGFLVHPRACFEPSLIMEAYLGAQYVVSGIFDTGEPPWAMIDTDDATKIQRVAQIHLASLTLYKLITHPNLGRLAAEATGAKTVKIWGTQLYLKRANSGAGGVVGYHRDSEHMPYFSKGSITAWIPLNHFCASAGPLHFVRGSHLWPHSTDYSGAQHQQREQQQAQLKAHYNSFDWQEVVSTLVPGSVSFHHQEVLHGSPPNTSNSDRWALGVGLLIDDYQINPNANNYGFADILDDAHACPTIYTSP